MRHGPAAKQRAEGLRHAPARLTRGLGPRLRHTMASRVLVLVEPGAVVPLVDQRPILGDHEASPRRHVLQPTVLPEPVDDLPDLVRGGVQERRIQAVRGRALDDPRAGAGAERVSGAPLALVVGFRRDRLDRGEGVIEITRPRIVVAERVCGHSDGLSLQSASACSGGCLQLLLRQTPVQRCVGSPELGSKIRCGRSRLPSVQQRSQTAEKEEPAKSPALTSNRPALLVLYCGRVSWGLVHRPVVSGDGEGVAARDARVSEVTFAGAVVEAVEVPLLVSVEERAARRSRQPTAVG